MANSASQERNVLSKCLKPSYEETCFDRISQLPDVLIHHVLSFLPTKDAVATSILSKRWLWLWTSVPLLDLKDSPSCIISEKLRTDFIQFVTQVLIFNSVSSLDKLCLKLHPIYPSFVNIWIQNAVARDIQELDITIYPMETFPFFKLPCDIFTTKTLNILKLSHGIELDVPGTISLPRLKVLHLVWIKYRDDESISRLFDGCLVLQELLVKKLDGDNAQTLNISIPTLTRLSLWFPTGCGANKLQINAPILEYLYLEDNLPSGSEYQIDNVSNLVEANLSVSLLGNNHVPLVKALCNAKFLSFSWNWYTLREWCFCNTFPLHLNLVRLELCVGCCGWTVLSCFLESCHNLEFLVLNKGANCRGIGLECYWKPPNTVPKCFRSSLVTVYFRGFEGLRYQMRMVRYILENARVLKKMDISTDASSYTYSLDTKFGMLKNLSMFPRRSKTCQLQFS